MCLVQFFQMYSYNIMHLLAHLTVGMGFNQIFPSFCIFGAMNRLTIPAIPLMPRERNSRRCDSGAHICYLNDGQLCPCTRRKRSDVARL